MPEGRKILLRMVGRPGGYWRLENVGKAEMSLGAKALKEGLSLSENKGQESSGEE